MFLTSRYSPFWSLETGLQAAKRSTQTNSIAFRNAVFRRQVLYLVLDLLIRMYIGAVCDYQPASHRQVVLENKTKHIDLKINRHSG